MEWWNKIRLRRDIVSELKRQKRVMEIKRWSIQMQMTQIDSKTRQTFSLPYRIKFVELLDISEELGKVDGAIQVRGLWYILTGKVK